MTLKFSRVLDVVIKLTQRFMSYRVDNLVCPISQWW